MFSRTFFKVRRNVSGKITVNSRRQTGSIPDCLMCKKSGQVAELDVNAALEETT